MASRRCHGRHMRCATRLFHSTALALIRPREIEEIWRMTEVCVLSLFRYSGGFVGVDRTIRRFWSVVESMNETERAALLRFVTSCERPPPLGFESMHPPFCVHRVGIRTDDERLPTASTCFNTLKLPTYSSEKVVCSSRSLCRHPRHRFESAWWSVIMAKTLTMEFELAEKGWATGEMLLCQGGHSAIEHACHCAPAAP